MESYYYKALTRTNDRLDAISRILCKQKSRNTKTTIIIILLVYRIYCLNEEVKDLRKKVEGE